MKALKCKTFGAELTMHTCHDVIYDVLREEGFSTVESISHEVDPSYTGDIDLQAYIDLHDSKVILAWK